MPDAPSTLKAAFDAARIAGDHARMAELGPRLYPEPGEDRTLGEGLSWGDKFRAKVAANYRAKEEAAKGTGTLGAPRAAVETRIAELRKAPMLEPAFRRDARLAKLEQAQRALYEATQTAAREERAL